MHRLKPLLFTLAFVLQAQAADLPAYVKEALAHFHPDVPAGWAYDLTTHRANETSMEHFDPSQPIGRQWTLLQRNSLPATAEDSSRYDSYRISTSNNTHATFQRGDIDLDSVQLVSEDERVAEFRARFRSDLDDQMLRMLELQFTVVKQPAHIKQFVFQLTGPYSPVLTVTMSELRVETFLSAPEGDRPALPLRTTSRFRGRVLLFKHIAEDVETSYSAFRRVAPLPSRTTPPPS